MFAYNIYAQRMHTCLYFNCIINYWFRIQTLFCTIVYISWFNFFFKSKYLFKIVSFVFEQTKSFNGQYHINSLRIRRKKNKYGNHYNKLHENCICFEEWWYHLKFDGNYLYECASRTDAFFLYIFVHIPIHRKF